MKTLIALVSFALLVAGFDASAEGTKAKIKAAAVAVKDDTKEIAVKVGDKAKSVVKKVKAKIHEKTK